MDNRKTKNGSNLKITYSELMRELEEYEKPITNKRIFTKEQDMFLRKAREKGVSVREIQRFWGQCWDGICRDTLRRRIKELGL